MLNKQMVLLCSIFFFVFFIISFLLLLTLIEIDCKINTLITLTVCISMLFFRRLFSYSSFLIDVILILIESWILLKHNHYRNILPFNLFEPLSCCSSFYRIVNNICMYERCNAYGWNPSISTFLLLSPWSSFDFYCI